MHLYVPIPLPSCAHIGLTCAKCLSHPTEKHRQKVSGNISSSWGLAHGAVLDICSFQRSEDIDSSLKYWWILRQNDSHPSLLGYSTWQDMYQPLSRLSFWLRSVGSYGVCNHSLWDASGRGVGALPVLPLARLAFSDLIPFRVSPHHLSLWVLSGESVHSPWEWTTKMVAVGVTGQYSNHAVLLEGTRTNSSRHSLS